MTSLTLFLYPILAALALALVAGPIGCFVNWRRMAFYSDTLSHAALLGIALGLLAGVGALCGVVGMAILASLALLLLQRKTQLASDALLAILAQAALAAGILIIYLQPRLQVNLYGFLFGDVLAISEEDALALLACGAAVLLALLAWWRPLLLVTLHEELAQAEGIPVGRLQALLMLLIALTVATGIYVAGVMMVSSLLVIPAATARAFARTPRGMALGAAVLGVASVGAGLTASFQHDLPPGSSIVLAASALFILAQLWQRVHRTT
jgi:zinc transport system permease protein